MIRRRRVAVIVAPVVAVGSMLTGCADDASDGAYRVRRAEVLVEERRATSTTEPADTAAPVSSDASVETVPIVEPTGLVVPVIALDNSFRPEVVEISVGDEVVWENRGMNEHDVLYVEGDDWGVEVEGFQPGDVYSHVFAEPGEYRYYCSIHGSTEVGMVGTVVVTG